MAHVPSIRNAKFPVPVAGSEAGLSQLQQGYFCFYFFQGRAVYNSETETMKQSNHEQRIFKHSWKSVDTPR
jgi:hypothetical protein